LRHQRHDQRNAHADAPAGGRSREETSLHSTAQRKSARRKSLGLAHAGGEQEMKLLIAGCGLLIGGAIAIAQQPPQPVFTADQAAAGRASYQANCASCHLLDLVGRNEAPQLAGNNFMNAWRTRTTKDLFDYVQTMP